jgi:hypothetical protein
MRNTQIVDILTLHQLAVAAPAMEASVPPTPLEEVEALEATVEAALVRTRTSYLPHMG